MEAILYIILTLVIAEAITISWQTYYILKKCKLFLYSNLELRELEIIDIQIRSIHRTELKLNVICSKPFILHSYRHQLEMYLSQKLERTVKIKKIKSL